MWFIRTGVQGWFHRLINDHHPPKTSISSFDILLPRQKQDKTVCIQKKQRKLVNKCIHLLINKLKFINMIVFDH